MNLFNGVDGIYAHAYVLFAEVIALPVPLSTPVLLAECQVDSRLTAYRKRAYPISAAFFVSSTFTHATTSANGRF